MIRVRVYEPAAGEPVSLSDAKQWLRLDGDETDDDGVVYALVRTARARVEELRRRSHLVQTFDAYYDRSDLPSCGSPLPLPRNPVVSVVSIRGFGSSEATDTGGTAMTTSDYYVDVASEPGRVVPVNWAAWPTATRDVNALVVRFTAGYSTASEGVPERLKTEVKQLVTKLYEHRGDEAEMAAILADYDNQPSDDDLPEWG